MNLAIMQPYFFPYLGYFQLMDVADEWVIFDNVQFISKGWVNRNRILHADPQKGWQYITIPLSNRSRFSKINEITISNKQNWTDSILGKLTIYKKAPHYKKTIDFIEECLTSPKENLSEFLEKTLIKTSKHLGIETPISSFSKKDWKLPEITHPGQWALEISKIKNAERYINLYGGSEIFNQEEFDESGINIEFLKPTLNNYPQYRDRFIEGLSIIDIMMWNDKRSIQKMLKRDFSLYTKEEIEGLVK